MSKDEQSNVTARPEVFDPYPSQELQDVTLDLFGRTTEAQNIVYNLHSEASFTPSGAFNLGHRSTRVLYSTLKQDFLQSAETAGTYSYLAEATNLIQRLGELGVSTFVDISQGDEEDTTTESAHNSEVSTIQEGANATTPPSNGVRTALDMTNSKAEELLNRVHRLLSGVQSWKNLGATRVPDDVTRSAQESFECLQRL